MRYLSLFSGIEAASCAWNTLGFEPVAFSEIDKFPCNVLKARYPDVPNLGDITKITKEQLNALGKIDLIVGGSPCQGFSVAGYQKGLNDERSQLALEYLRIIADTTPEWILWENVPGVFCTNRGMDFRKFIYQITKLGYGCAWRVFDAQYFGVPQRRRRVFLVGRLGGGANAAAKVLFECESMSGNIKKSDGEKENITPATQTSIRKTSNIVFDFTHACDVVRQGNTSPSLTAHMGEGGNNVPVVFSESSFGQFKEHETAGTLKASGGNLGGGSENLYFDVMYRLRKLTPKECLRLQGFPDDWFENVEGYSDTAAYKAIGNSMAVPVMKWIGERIKKVNEIQA